MWHLLFSFSLSFSRHRWRFCWHFFVHKMQRIFKFLMFWFLFGMLVLSFSNITSERYTFFANNENSNILKTMPLSLEKQMGAKKKDTTNQTQFIHRCSQLNCIQKLSHSLLLIVLIFSYQNILIAPRVYRLWLHFMKSLNWNLLKIHMGILVMTNLYGSFFSSEIDCKLQSILVFIVSKSILNENCSRTEQKKANLAFNEGNCFGNWIRLTIAMHLYEQQQQLHTLHDIYSIP